MALDRPAGAFQHSRDYLGMRRVIARRRIGRDAHHLLQEGDLFVEVGVDPAGETIVQGIVHGAFPVLVPVTAPDSNHAPTWARSASVMWVRFASGMALDCTVCW